ncbi:TPA: hypothetical protein NID03_003160 [Pseudomonas aeruginosa]|uniref:hypothetical protein n=1 Tax=Pseudomonas aeruginosa TaxID=287 RepID=UPI0004478AF8|nr:hypothetical protein [Pseudomonas aeruginosa]EZO07180.1 hypothetical protein AJ64_02537 [Pseudomonas aeruginosa 3577]MBI8697925.1 hypothetical protein [Pseudomonas aeruginosa]MBP8322982.1 hypothetical protein [Pseudomonas aeruginosa]MBP8358664.1 hypothetical protein [Pseudomonas aeruginosa]MBP8364407.1 hypothetical protein [Pseudomonas aeruginosa]
MDAILRTLWLKDIHLAKGPRKITTESFLTKKNATIINIENKNSLTLYIGNPSLTKKFFSHEADRFACAAFETLTSPVPENEPPRSIGWTLIKAYYSAFFSMHALLRIHGWACTRIAGNAIRFINDELKILAPDASPVGGGIFLIKSDPSGRTLELKKLEAGTTGGSHESLWATLNEYFNNITYLIQKNENLDTQEVSKAIQSIVDFSTFLSSKGGPIWLTQVRNRINYQHAYGAWHPYTDSTCDLIRIRTELDKWNSPIEQTLPNETADELIQFSSCCSFIAALCKQTVAELYKRGSPQSPFKQNSGKIIKPST